MSLNNLNPLIMHKNYGQNQFQGNNQSFSPQEWEYIQTMRRTGWDMGQQNQIQQSDPYNDFVNEFFVCSPTVKNKILNDDTFKSAMDECDRKIQSMVEDIIRPRVMQTPDGRLSFEKMLAVFRQIKEKYIKEESENMEALQKVMQDDVVKKRIAEITNSGGGVNS